MQAMVLRMKERDEAKKQEKGGSKVLETNNSFKDMSNAQLKELIPELRKKAREKYVLEREEKQMDLYKKLIDADEKMFATISESSNVVDQLIRDI